VAPLDTAPSRVPWWRAWVPGRVAVAAVLSWLVAMTVGCLGVRAVDINPLTTRGALLPIAIGAVAGLILIGVATLWRSATLVGVTAGAYAAWVGVTIYSALLGTPYGYGFQRGDAGRMAALVTHFTATWHPTDAADPSLPPEYPPLYPMLLGRFAAVAGRSGWSVVGLSQVVLVPVAILAAFLLWQRLMPALPAFLAAATVTAGLAEPSKGNEIVSLAVFVPWVLASFWPPPTVKRLHPVVAGLIIGLLVPWSPNVLFLSVLGLAVVIVQAVVRTWRRPPERRAALVHVGITVIVGLVVASWYLVPLGRAYAGGRSEVVADLFLSGQLVTAPFSLAGSPSLLLYALQVLGLIGLVAGLRRSWWAEPMALLAAGILVFRAVMLVRFVNSGHTFMLLYVGGTLRYILCVAGVFTAYDVWAHQSWRYVRRVNTRALGLALTAGLVATLGFSGWQAWVPAPVGIKDNTASAGANAATGQAGYNTAMLAHAQPLPDDRRPRFAAPSLLPPFDSQRIARTVAGVLGPAARPATISANQQIFSSQDWPSWLPYDRTSSSALIQWDHRHALLTGIATKAGNADPAAMSTAMATAPYGGIRVLILKQTSTAWTFGDVSFTPSSFAGPQFAVTTGLPGGYVLVIRR
jgi:hypothetical protein